jgi:hypothetical protein
VAPGALPNVIVIGAMKCATSALHRYLDAHPDVAMSRLKELNFFNGPERPPHDDPETWWVEGQWHRGVDWYRSQFDPEAPVRGESSPAYTSPTFPEVAERMARVVPDARLLYLVRDPVDRAVSQYAHHRRDGAESRPLREAVLDPGSQYVDRSRYHERLVPFLDHFRRDRFHVVVQERLLHDRGEEIGRVYEYLQVDPRWRDPRHDERIHVGGDPHEVDPSLRREVMTRVSDDVQRLRELIGDDLHEWRAA